MTEQRGKTRDNKRKNAQKLKKRRHEMYLQSLRDEILTHAAPELSAVCSEVGEGEDLSFIDRMKKVLGATPYGVGLAANQLGVTKRVCVWRSDSKSRLIKAMINPVIIEKSDDTEVLIEGCLSYPGKRCPISRSLDVKVSYLDEKLAQKTETFKGLEARILQHEVDHLDGTCQVKDLIEAVKKAAETEPVEQSV